MRHNKPKKVHMPTTARPQHTATVAHTMGRGGHDCTAKQNNSNPAKTKMNTPKMFAALQPTATRLMLTRNSSLKLFRVLQ